MYIKKILQKITLVFLLGLPFSLSAQKLQTMLADSISGDTVKITAFEKIYGSPGLLGKENHQVEFQFTRMKNIYFISLALQTGKNRPFMVPAGATLTLQLADNSVITLTNTAETIAEFNRVNIGSSVKINYLVMRPDLLKIQNIPVSALLVAYKGGVFTYKLSEKNAAKLSACSLLVI